MQAGNQGAIIRFESDLKPQFTTFGAVPHPNSRPMQYAGEFQAMLR
jgi:serine/threonine-protein phosphatase 5